MPKKDDDPADRGNYKRSHQNRKWSRWQVNGVAAIGFNGQIMNSGEETDHQAGKPQHRAAQPGGRFRPAFRCQPIVAPGKIDQASRKKADAISKAGEQCRDSQTDAGDEAQIKHARHPAVWLSVAAKVGCHTLRHDRTTTGDEYQIDYAKKSKCESGKTIFVHKNCS